MESYDALDDCSCKYYSVEEFNVGGFDSRDYLRIIHQNIRSFHHNYDEFSIFLSKLKPKFDIMVFTETWFSDLSEVNIPGFRCFNLNRPSKRGGGVAIYVRSNIKCHLNNDWLYTCDYIEIISVKLELACEKINIITVYRPPDGSMSDFNSYINREVLSKITPRNSTIILGDFNINLLDPCSGGLEFVNDCKSKSFLPLINKPTRVGANGCATVIDHIWSNKISGLETGIFECDITDHYAIFCCMMVTNSRTPIKKYFRDHSDSCLNLLKARVNDFVSSYRFENSNDVDSKFENFLSNIFKLYNSCCPIKCKTLSFKRYTKPWITSSVMHAINRKHDLFREYKNNRISFEIYNMYKLTCDNLLRECRSRFFENKFLQIQGDMKETWKQINYFTKPSNNDRNITLCDDGRDVSDGCEVANLLNNFFSTIGSRLKDEIPSSEHDPISFMGSRSLNSFFCVPSTPGEVKRVICSLKPKGSHINNIPCFIFKILGDCLSPIISNLFNVSLDTGKFPNILKYSTIVPVPKSRNLKNINNFRPIATNSVLSKIIEKLMCTRLKKFLNSSKTFFDSQFGFRSGHATTDAVLQFLDYAYESVDSKKYLLTVFIDLKKAFDTVDLNILLRKLNHIGIRGTSYDWFSSYLLGRKQCVRANKFTSEYRETQTGVPQGSILGPILFLIYINDMHNSAPGLTFVQFADDTTVFSSHENLESLVEIVNTQMRYLYSWVCANKLSLNAAKTSYIIISNRKIENYSPVKVCETEISRSHVLKFLGVILDNRLNFDKHIESVVGKISRATGIMRRLKSFVSPKVLTNVYNALINSHLNYCVSAWGASGVSFINKVKSAQRRAVKLFENRNESKILSFENIYKVNISCILHRIVNQNYHNFSFVKLESIQNYHGYETRFQTDDRLTGPFCRTKRSQQNFMYHGVKAWNQIPSDLRLIKSLPVFKRKLKELYLRQVE